MIQKEGGSPAAEQKGVEIVRRLKKICEKQKRVPCSVADLVVGVQCGGSDWTTALSANPVIGAMSDLVLENGGSVLMSEVAGFPGSEHIVASRAISERVFRCLT